uniref:Class 3 lipase protein n=1 Tax=Haemonchus contortus TaxID=6289 RepID=E0YDN6_HAECO|nr:class 3 lipase protein [Haemonchus contortus]
MLLGLVVCGLLHFTTSSPTSSNVTYSDMEARTEMFPLAAAAYSKQPQDCLNNRYTNATLKRQLFVVCGPLGRSDMCSGFTAVLHDKKAIVISFRGTTAFIQLVMEADQSVFYRKIPWIGGGYVSKFFYDGFITLWKAGIGDDFQALRTQYPTYDVWVTGHSLGAALASLASSYIITVNKVPSESVKLVTFGQPRVGDTTYAMAHDDQLAFSFRLVHWRDLVPHVPPLLFLDYYRHKSEVFYQDNMAVGVNFTVCYANESPNCSDGLQFPTSIWDHIHYFNVHVGHYGKHGCNTTLDSPEPQ